MHKRRLTTLLLPLSFAIAAQASDEVYTLDDIVVTATRTAQTVDQTLAPVSVVTREDIEQKQAATVPELLETLPGVQIATSGGPGSTTSMFIRGTSSSQSIVLIDGQRIGSATLGTASIQHLSPDQIERIEVVRGPKSSLYGADAIGGVVNIITRSSDGKQHASVKAGYGSQNTRSFSANIGEGNEATNYHVGLSRFITDGFDRTTDKKGNNGDKDFYSNTTVSAKANHQFSKTLKSGISFYQSEGTSAYDDIWNPQTKPRGQFKEQALTAYSTYNVSDDWRSTLTLSRTLDDTVNSRDAYQNKIKTTRNILNWQNDVMLGNNTLVTGGFEYNKDSVDSTTKYEEDSRYNNAVFAQTQTAFKQSDLLLSLRRDHNQYYGNNTTGNIAYGYNLPDEMRLIASYGTAFKAPSFNDLYWPGYGDPTLKPEESENYELELRGRFTSGTWAISVFQNEIDNLITTQNQRATSTDKTRIRGLELSTIYNIADWTMRSSVSLLDPKELRKHESDRILTDRARLEGSLDISKQLGLFYVGGSMLAKSKTYSYSGSNRETATNGFATFDLRASWQATKELKADLKLVNLLDKEYQTKQGYNEQPRGIFASLTWSPAI